ncbi:AraC family transcriptional activator of tynA and feaB [Bradyrhizobium sp. USDA 4509]
MLCDFNRRPWINSSADLRLTNGKHVETIFSTSSVHPRDRFDYWHSLACKKIVGHDSVPENRLTFQAEIKAAKFGNLDLVEFSNSPMQVSHTLGHVERTGPDTLFLCYQLSGRVLIVQNAREVNLDAGSLMLLEPLLPYDAKFLPDSKTLLIKVPRRELRARIGTNRELIGRRVTAERTDDDLALSVAAKLPSLAGRTASITEEMVGNHVLDLLGLSIARTIGSATVRVSNSKALLLGQIRSVVEARLTDPDLDGQKVADIVGISVRYANALLAEQDSSLHRLILSRRLSRCRFALEDPNQVHRTIAEIAQGWGFSDMTHFGRCFKGAYGVSPREYQKAAAQSRQDGRP